MTHDIRNDLEAEDANDLVPLAQMLESDRPVPSARFRGDLRRHLMAGRHGASRPARLWVRIGAPLSSGAGLIVVAAAGVAGAGPFAV